MMKDKPRIRWKRLAWCVAPVAAFASGFMLYVQLTTKGTASARCVIVRDSQTIVKAAGIDCQEESTTEPILIINHDKN